MDTEALFRAHHEEIRRYLVRYTGDRTLAEDAAQDAFVRLAEHPPTRTENLRGWLFTVATNLARESLRRRRNRRRLLDESGDQVPTPSPELSPEETWERKELRRRVRTALDDLSHRERTVLLMREEGFRHGEIAEAVETTTGSVGTMIARALEKLSRELDLETRGADGE